MKSKIAVIAAACLLAAAPAARAVDGMAVEVGGGDGTDMARVALQWNWNKRWFQGQDWHLGGYWDLGIGHWHDSSTAPGENSSITEIGLTPVFRIQRNEGTGPYGEIGIGAHFLSSTQIGDKRLSTAFQFGDHLGFGYRFGTKASWDLAYRFQHLSNGSIKKPNDGINFHLLRVQYHF